MANNGFPTPKSNRKITSYTNLNKDLVLSPADMGATVIIDNSNGYYVILPDCRLLTVDVKITVVNRSTVNHLNVVDNNGLLIKSIIPQSSTTYACISRLSSGGQWSSTNVSFDLLNSMQVGVVNTVASVACVPTNIIAM